MNDEKLRTHGSAPRDPAGIVIGTGALVSLIGLAFAAGRWATALPGQHVLAGVAGLPVEYPFGLLAAGVGLVALARNRLWPATLAAFVLAAMAVKAPLVKAAAALAQSGPGEMIAQTVWSLAGLSDPVPRVAMIATGLGLLFAVRSSTVGPRRRRVAASAAIALATSGAGIVGLLTDIAPVASVAGTGAALMVGTVGIGAAAAGLMLWSANRVTWHDRRWVRWAVGPIVTLVFTSGVLLGIGLLYVQEGRDAESQAAQARWLAATLDELLRRQQEELVRMAAYLGQAERRHIEFWRGHLESLVKPADGLDALALLDRRGTVHWVTARADWTNDRMTVLTRSDAVQRAVVAARAQTRTAASSRVDLGDGAQGYVYVIPVAGRGEAGGFLLATFRVSPLPVALNSATLVPPGAPRAAVTYGAQDPAGNDASRGAGFSSVALRVGDGGWRLHLPPAASLGFTADRVLAWVVLAGSVVTAALLFGVLRLWRLAALTGRVLEAKNERLRRSSALLESAGEVAQVGGWEFDLGRRALRWTGQALRMLGCRPGQIRSLDEVFQAFDRPAHTDVRDAFERAIETGEPFAIEQPLVTYDGRRIHVRIAGRARRSGSETVALYGAIQDITAARRTTDELRSSHARLRAIIETTVDGIVTIDEDRRIESFNLAAERMFGYRAADVIGRNVSILMPEPAASEHDGYVRRYLAGGAPRIIGIGREVQGRRADGTVFPLDLAISEARFGTRRLFVGLTRDITERKRIEASLIVAKETAEKANRAKSEFLSRMSHELRTPLNAILGFAQILELNQKEPLTPTQAEHVAQIGRAGWQLLTMINEVLDLARIDTGQFELRRARVPLGAVVRECAALVGPLLETYRVSLTICDEALARHAVLADADRLKHVVFNLLGNAVKYNRQGGRVTVTATLTDRGRVRLSVADTGRGLAPDQLGRVFEPFERAGAERTTIEGAGIGLTVAKRLVEAMGGAIGADSELGVGSTFWVELDEAAGKPHTDEGAGGSAGKAERVLPAPRATKRVLYVEDSPANVRLMRQVLASRPHIELLSASSAAEGLALAREEPLDLILIDIGLPGADGFELKRQLDAHPPLARAPIIALSGDACAMQAERGRAAGFVDYLTKPVDVARLLRLIDTLLPGGAR
jgi:PAS domain S-box-containing protein